MVSVVPFKRKAFENEMDEARDQATGQIPELTYNQPRTCIIIFET